MKNNYAFIDSNNLYLSLTKDIYNQFGKRIYIGWRLDYRRFLIYLKDKYQVDKAFLFLGYQRKHYLMYQKWQRIGYQCIFKPVSYLSKGRIKGNIDTEMTLYALTEMINYDQAIIVSGDGDFHCLATYLIKKEKLRKILIPNRFCGSILLTKLSSPTSNMIDFLDDLKGKLSFEGK